MMHHDTDTSQIVIRNESKIMHQPLKSLLKSSGRLTTSGERRRLSFSDENGFKLAEVSVETKKKKVCFCILYL